MHFFGSGHCFLVGTIICIHYLIHHRLKAILLTIRICDNNVAIRPCFKRPHWKHLLWILKIHIDQTCPQRREQLRFSELKVCLSLRCFLSLKITASQKRTLGMLCTSFLHSIYPSLNIHFWLYQGQGTGLAGPVT